MVDDAASGGRVVRLVAESGCGRLDVFVCGAVEGLSRSRAAKLVEGGFVVVNGGGGAKAASAIRAGDVVVVTLPPPAPPGTQGEDIPLVVLFEDEHIIAVDKPRGMSAHPSAAERGGTLVNALVHRCGDSLSGIGGEQRPGIVHRLDKDTSGVMVVAKSDAAHEGLSAQFAGRSVEKHYTAVVHGDVRGACGTVDAAVGRDVRDRKKMAVVSGGRGRGAVTEWRVLERVGGFCVVDARPLTGRTHQIRVHFAHIGHPVAGDPLYSGRVGRARGDEVLREALEGLGGQALHASSLEFTHPVTGERMKLVSPLPERIETFLGVLRGRGRGRAGIDH